MAWTTEDLEELEAAIASGVQSFQFRDRSETYRGLKELQAIRKMIRRELGLDTPASSGFGARGQYAKTSKGT